MFTRMLKEEDIEKVAEDLHPFTCHIFSIGLIAVGSAVAKLAGFFY